MVRGSAPGLAPALSPGAPWVQGAGQQVLKAVEHSSLGEAPSLPCVPVPLPIFGTADVVSSKQGKFGGFKAGRGRVSEVTSLLSCVRSLNSRREDQGSVLFRLIGPQSLSSQALLLYIGGRCHSNDSACQGSDRQPAWEAVRDG